MNNQFICTYEHETVIYTSIIESEKCVFSPLLGPLLYASHSYSYLKSAQINLLAILLAKHWASRDHRQSMVTLTEP